jgi:hypothetical protein
VFKFLRGNHTYIQAEQHSRVRLPCPAQNSIQSCMAWGFVARRFKRMMYDLTTSLTSLFSNVSSFSSGNALPMSFGQCNLAKPASADKKSMMTLRTSGNTANSSGVGNSMNGGLNLRLVEVAAANAGTAKFCTETGVAFFLHLFILSHFNETRPHKNTAIFHALLYDNIHCY